MVKVAAVAVVGRGNAPLYTEIFEGMYSSEGAQQGTDGGAVGDVALALECLMYASLDVCEEIVTSLVQEMSSNSNSTTGGGGVSRVAAPGQNTPAGAGARPFLGDLMQDKGYETWGMQTTSGTKIIIATKGSRVRERSDILQVERLLQQVNAQVSHSLCCPFTTKLSASPRFVESLRSLLLNKA